MLRSIQSIGNVLDCINIWISDVFKSLIQGDGNKTECCYLVMLIKHLIVHKNWQLYVDRKDKYHALDSYDNKMTKWN